MEDRRRLLTSLVLSAATLFVALLLTLPAYAERVVSFEFDSPSDLDGWTLLEGDGDITWNPNDASGSSSSGSVEFRNCCGSALVVQISRCIPVSSPTAVTLSMGWRRDAPVPSNALVFSFYRLFPDSTCSSDDTPDSVFLDILATSKPEGQWHTDSRIDSTGGFSANSLILFVGSHRREQSAFMYSYADDVRLTLQGEDLPGSVEMRGPASGVAGSLLRFEATGNNCDPSSPTTGWIWTSPDATVHGYTDRNTIDLGWSDSGTRTVTASHPACGSASASKQVVIDPGEPRVQVWPGASILYQPVGTTLGRTAYSINNYGEQPALITVEPEGEFFTQSPSGTVSIAPGAWEKIEVAAKNVPEGIYRERTYFSGDGLTQFLIDWGQLIQLVVFSTEPTDGEARPDRNRVDVTGGDASVTFSNSGTLPLEALVIATKPWIVPDVDQVTIPAGSSAAVGFSIDRSERPDAEDPFGSVSGEFGLEYVTTAGSGKGSPAGPHQSTSTSKSVVTVVDTAPPPATESGIPALAAGEVALFIPGVGHVVGSVGTFISDLSLVNLRRNEPLSNLQLYFNPRPGSPGKGSQRATVSMLQPNQPVALADVVGTVFGQDAQLGSLQLRSGQIDSIGLAATVFNVSNPAGTYGTTIPVIRSDRGAGPGQKVWLAGVRSDATHHTNLFIQETSGNAVSVKIDFVGESANVIGTRTETVAGFAMVQLGNVVPEAAVSIVLTNVGSSGSFFAYATPVDRASGDTWAVSDWPRQLGYSRSEPAVIPVAGALRGANETFFRTDAAIINTGSASASGTLRYLDRIGPVIDREIALAPGETKIYEDITTTLFGITDGTVGHMRWTPGSGEVVITSRNFTTVAGDVATFGSGVPTLAASMGVGPGELIRFGGVPDATLDTQRTARPASFRTNFGIVETAGMPVTVRVTVRFSVASSRATARAEARREFSLPANGFLLTSNLVRSVAGEQRDELLGDLDNVEVDFELSGGDGRILVFTSSVDNGTGDSILRTE